MKFSVIRVGPIAVLAGTRNEFVEYKRQNSDKKMVFCNRWPEFAGFEFQDFVEIGTFRLRPDALQIYQQVLPMMRPNIESNRLADNERHEGDKT